MTQYDLEAYGRGARDGKGRSEHSYLDSNELRNRIKMRRAIADRAKNKAW